MRKQKHDFKNPRNSSEDFYDVEFDKDLIESSFATQYGIRLRQEPDITYPEWARLLSGLMPETPLGRIVQIRAEKDRKVIKTFGAFEKKVRKDWAVFKASKVDTKTQNNSIADLQAALKSAFCKKGVKK